MLKPDPALEVRDTEALEEETLQPTTELIGELVRAANSMATISEFSRARLLDKASDQIRILRIQNGLPVTVEEKDSAFNAFVMARSVPRYSDEQISDALLDAARTMRLLRISSQNAGTTTSS